MTPAPESPAAMVRSCDRAPAVKVPTYVPNLLCEDRSGAADRVVDMSPTVRSAVPGAVPVDRLSRA